jgi:hypothetical protein
VAVAGGASGTQAAKRRSRAAYVYGVVRGGTLQRLDAEGVSSAAVEQIERDGLVALTSPLPTKDLRVKRRDLHRHLQVLEEAFAATTILPCPFGTVVASTDEIENDLLVAQRDELLSALDRLDGKVQMNVKAAYVEEELLLDIVSTQPEIARLRESAKQLGDAGYYAQLQLGELVAEAVAARREHDADRLLRELARSADDVAVEDAQEFAVKASFLVDRSELTQFDEVLEAIAGREQPLLQFEVIGPLPPTAFTSAYTEV